MHFFVSYDTSNRYEYHSVHLTINISSYIRHFMKIIGSHSNVHLTLHKTEEKQYQFFTQEMN